VRRDGGGGKKVAENVVQGIDASVTNLNNSAPRLTTSHAVRSRQATTIDAPVAQLDRVPGYEPGGREFESLRARHIEQGRGLAPRFVLIGRNVRSAEFEAADLCSLRKRIDCAVARPYHPRARHVGMPVRGNRGV
jgi:hypothetical protein